MKTIATKQTNTSTAAELQQEMIKIVREFFTSKELIYIDQQIKAGETINLPDKHTSYSLSINSNKATLYGESSNGTQHELTVYSNGIIRVAHNGSLRSYPGLLMTIVYAHPEFFNSDNGWKLEIY